jgi:starch synthase
VPPGDPEALAAAIADLLRDPARAERLGAAAAERAKDFGVAPVTRRHLAFFEQVAGRG